MRLVNWPEILPGAKMKVLFSALALPPHTDQIDANLAAIELPGDLFVDVEWVRKIGKYIVTLFREDIDNVLSTRECKDAYEVIDAVCGFVLNAPLIQTHGRTLESASDSNERPPVIWNGLPVPAKAGNVLIKSKVRRHGSEDWLFQEYPIIVDLSQAPAATPTAVTASDTT